MNELVKLFNDDCMNILPKIPSKSIDLVIIDPPYLFSPHGGGGAFGEKKRKYHTELNDIKSGFDNEVLEELYRVMKLINIYIWCNKNQLNQLISFFESKGATTDLLSWHKSNPVPTCGNKYLSDTEYLLFFREKGVSVYGTYATKKKYYITSTNKEDKAKYNHPTVKPLDIIKNLVVNSSLPTQTVLDCYMGSGTTGAAVLEVGEERKFIGIELDKEHFQTCITRLGEYLW